MSLVAESQVAESQLAESQLAESQVAESREAVPVVDIGGYFSGTAAEKQRVAREIGEACRTIGFLLVSGHGVSSELIERTQGTGRAFFDLPDTVKRRFGAPDPSIYRGYYAMETNAVAYSRDDRAAAPDYRELFSINRKQTRITPRRWAGGFSHQISGPRGSPSRAKRGPNTTTPW
jgi:isopenicillin N synthase-like dioxygenase